jgi:FMN-dependent dehydrogenase
MGAVDLLPGTTHGVVGPPSSGSARGVRPSRGHYGLPGLGLYRRQPAKLIVVNRPAKLIVALHVIGDGSFCRGTDIIKAIAVGADLVGLGRMQCFALAAGGEAAIIRMLELLEDEVQRSLGLLGVTAFAQLNRSYLHAAASPTPPSVLSAFPLLHVDDYSY